MSLLRGRNLDFENRLIQPLEYFNTPFQKMFLPFLFWSTMLGNTAFIFNGFNRLIFQRSLELAAHAPMYPTSPETSGDSPFKVMYFNARGRAEVSRILLKLAGIEFDDVVSY
jgi:hypothetical protein